MYFRNVYAAENSGPKVPHNNINHDVSVYYTYEYRTKSIVRQICKLCRKCFYALQQACFSLFNGNTQCSNSTSNSGSCFHLIGGSYIKLYAGSFTLFNNNKALLSGGAIYADNQGLPVDLCTVAIYTGSEKVFLRFENNSAQQLNNSRWS